jgi:hypothetical protein
LPPGIAPIDPKHAYTAANRNISARRAQRMLCQASIESLAHFEANTRGFNLTDSPSKLTREEGALRGIATRSTALVTDETLAANNADRRIGAINIDFHGPFAPDVQGVIGFWSYTPADGNIRTIAPVREKNFSTLAYGLNTFCTTVGTPTSIIIDRDTSAVANAPAHVTQFQRACADRGIALGTAPTGCHNENGRAERSGRTIYEHGTAAAETANVDAVRYSSFAAGFANYTMNRTPLKSIEMSTRFYVTHGRQPFVGHMHVPFCPVLVPLDKKARGPTPHWRRRTRRGMFVGYPSDQREGTYLIWCFDTCTLITTPFVYFDDDFKLVSKNPLGHGWVWKADMFEDPDVISGLDAAIGDANPKALPPIVAAIAAGAKDAKSVPADSIEVIKQRIRTRMHEIGDWSIWPEQNTFNADTDDFSLLPRTTKPANFSVSRPWLRSDGPVEQRSAFASITSRPIDYRIELSNGTAGDVDIAMEVGLVTQAELDAFSLSAFGDIGFAPAAALACSLDAWNPVTACDIPIGAIINCDVPDGPPPIAPLRPIADRTMRKDVFPNVSAAKWSDLPPVRWGSVDRDFRNFELDIGIDAARAAWIAEHKGIYDAGCVAHVELPKGFNGLLSTRTINKVKPPSNEYPDGRAKCRTVGGGHRQRLGTEFSAHEKPAPVATHQSQRSLDIVAVKRSIPLRVIDAKLAFLGGVLDKLYLCRPPAGIDLGVGPNGRPIVWLLLRSLYGLVECPQIWFKTYAGWLVSQGYKQCPVDPALFVHATSPDLRAIAIHVDDSKLCFEDKNEEVKFIEALLEGPAKHGGISDLGYDFGECCGVEYIVTPNGYILKLERWLTDVARTLDIVGGNSKDVPLPDRLQPLAGAEEALPLTADEHATYLKYVGILQWPVTCGVKPQFAYAASYLGSRRSKPVQYDLTLARRAIKLLIAGKSEGVRIERGADLPSGFESEWASDSDWAHDKGTYLSHGGHIGFWGGLPLLARSSRHKSIARSSTHAEIMQLSACSGDIVIHRRTAGFLRHAPEQPALLRADNAAAITTAEQQIVLTDVARHIAIRFLYVRELVGHGIVTMRWVSTARNIADIFTKALAATVFNPMRCVIIGKDRSWIYY